jgi:hypothetical protein
MRQWPGCRERRGRTFLPSRRSRLLADPTRLTRDQSEVPAHRLGVAEAIGVIHECGHRLRRAEAHLGDAAQAGGCGRRRERPGPGGGPPRGASWPPSRACGSWRPCEPGAGRWPGRRAAPARWRAYRVENSAQSARTPSPRDRYQRRSAPTRRSRPRSTAWVIAPGRERPGERTACRTCAIIIACQTTPRVTIG